ncbi:hypothetical protein AHAS_Ahas11G0031700 [Arachis hypogaea]
MTRKVSNFSDLIQRVTANCLLYPLAARRYDAFAEDKEGNSFGADVMEVVVSWTKALCVDISQGRIPNHVDDVKAEGSELGNKVLSGWSVLDIGTGNGLLLQELAKQGFSDLTGMDYSEGAISLAQSVANRDDQKKQRNPIVLATMKWIQWKRTGRRRGRDSKEETRISYASSSRSSSIGSTSWSLELLDSSASSDSESRYTTSDKRRFFRARFGVFALRNVTTTGGCEFFWTEPPSK